MESSTLRKIALVLANLLCPTLLCADEGEAKALFARLKRLEGEWRIVESARDTKVTFEVTANGSALLEKWVMPPTGSSMTVYSLDGDRLLVTHYCPQGNAPRLLFDGVRDDDSYYFEFLDGLNLQDPNSSHQHAFWIRIDSPDSFSRSETYIRNGTSYAKSEPQDQPQTFVRFGQ